MKESFGEKLKKARVQKGLKQSELAKPLNVTNTTISNWENNISKPDLEMLTYICGVLDIKVSHLLEANPPKDVLSISESKIIEKYRLLDPHGKKMVDFTLNEEWNRSKKLKEQTTDDEHVDIPDHLAVKAAHNDSDITAEELQRMEEDIANLKRPY